MPNVGTFTLAAGYVGDSLREEGSLREGSARQALGSFICSGQADVLRGLRQPLNNPGVRQTPRHASRGSLVTHPA